MTANLEQNEDRVQVGSYSVSYGFLRAYSRGHLIGSISTDATAKDIEDFQAKMCIKLGLETGQPTFAFWGGYFQEPHQ